MHPPSPSKMKDDKPWLTGEFKTPKGRVITGPELCVSIDRLTQGYVDKYPPADSQYVGTGIKLPAAKMMSQEELESVVQR